MGIFVLTVGIFVLTISAGNTIDSQYKKVLMSLRILFSLPYSTTRISHIRSPDYQQINPLLNAYISLELITVFIRHPVKMSHESTTATKQVVGLEGEHGVEPLKGVDPEKVIKGAEKASEKTCANQPVTNNTNGDCKKCSGCE